MSLVVSLRVPDGIVVAADSLSTAHNIMQLTASGLEAKCPRCSEIIRAEDLKLPPIPIPFSASSYTQKLFAIGRSAVGTWGQGIVNKKSMQYHFDSSTQDWSKEANEGNLETLAKRIADYFEQELLGDLPKYKTEAPKDWYPIGFHLNGYEAIEGKQVGVTYQVIVGKDSKLKRLDSIGCTVGGDMKVVQKLWEIGKENQALQFKYVLLSLQDAIDLSQFLIDTTSKHQRFANEVATVGGAIDIALLTPFRGFQWIKRKELMEVLEKSNEQ